MWLVQKAQCPVGQKESVNVNYCHHGHQNNSSKDVHTLIPQTWEYVILTWQRDFAGIIKVGS